mmetsp:Transcript_20498/g.58289  ORF Transcript_20498/g.58289 Transcript_20498/m.58289 type:complete len:499 (+) Transcript_20498:660-2156(+)
MIIPYANLNGSYSSSQYRRRSNMPGHPSYAQPKPATPKVSHQIAWANFFISTSERHRTLSSSWVTVAIAKVPFSCEMASEDWYEAELAMLDNAIIDSEELSTMSRWFGFDTNKTSTHDGKFLVWTTTKGSPGDDQMKAQNKFDRSAKIASWLLLVLAQCPGAKVTSVRFYNDNSISRDLPNSVLLLAAKQFQNMMAARSTMEERMSFEFQGFKFSKADAIKLSSSFRSLVLLDCTWSCEDSRQLPDTKNFAVQEQNGVASILDTGKSRSSGAIQKLTIHSTEASSWPHDDDFLYTTLISNQLQLREVQITTFSGGHHAWNLLVRAVNANSHIQRFSIETDQSTFDSMKREDGLCKKLCDDKWSLRIDGDASSSTTKMVAYRANEYPRLLDGVSSVPHIVTGGGSNAGHTRPNVAGSELAARCHAVLKQRKKNDCALVAPMLCHLLDDGMANVAFDLLRFEIAPRLTLIQPNRQLLAMKEISWYLKTPLAAFLMGLVAK